MSRKTARKYAFELVFQLPFHSELDLNGAYDNKFSEFSSMSDADKNFIYQEFKGVAENVEKIDSYITKNLKNWTLDRLEKEVLAITRLAIYEMIFDDGIEVPVSINEAVELCKEYSDEKGRKFVHGVLSSVAKDLGITNKVIEEQEQEQEMQ